MHGQQNINKICRRFIVLIVEMLYFNSIVNLFEYFLVLNNWSTVMNTIKPFEVFTSGYGMEFLFSGRL
jgi:hypothetical protein